MLELPNLRRDVVLAPYTSYQIGGPADMFVEVGSVPELVAAVAAARAAGVDYFILGGGSNILMSDDGYRGLVIYNRARAIEVDTERHLITAESGATLNELIDAAAAAGLGDLEYFTYVPSSVGGAVRQNFHFVKVDAAAYAASGEIKNGETQYLADRVVEGVVLGADGSISRRDHDWFAFDYDYSRLLDTGDILLSTTFRVVDRSFEDIARQRGASFAWRVAKQPLLEDYPSCGSIFMKIEGVGAGRLIDQAGLKGATEGQIMVSPKHANYLVNMGGGTAAEVRRLIARIRREVKDTTGYTLEPEIGLVGDWSAWREAEAPAG